MARYLGGKVLDAEAAWARLLRAAGHWEMLGFGFWTVRERETGRFVGEVGLGRFHRDLVPSFGETPEMGWVLARWAQGQGFAEEAVRAALTWAGSRLPAERVVCMIDVDNAASLRLAARLGFAAYGRTTYDGAPVALLERPSRPRAG